MLFFHRRTLRVRTQLFLFSLTLATICLSATGAAPVNVSAAAPTIGGCPVFPADNIWNTPATTLQPIHNYDSFISSTGGNGLHPDFGAGTWQGAPIGIPYVAVP